MTSIKAMKNAMLMLICLVALLFITVIAMIATLFGPGHWECQEWKEYIIQNYYDNQTKMIIQIKVDSSKWESPRLIDMELIKEFSEKTCLKEVWIK